MSSLPDPNGFQGGAPQQDTSSQFDLNVYTDNLIQARKQLDPAIRDELAFELFPWSFYCFADPSFYWKTPRYAVGYSKKHQSLTLSLYQDKEVQAITIRRATDSEGNPIKWKTYGSKAFVPHRIDSKDDVVFVAEGMAEVLAFEILGVSYVCFQSASITQLPDEVKRQVAGKVAITLIDHDESGEKWCATVSRHFEFHIPLRMETLTGRNDLPKGYDFRDYINEVSPKEGPYFARATGEKIINQIMEVTE